MSFLRILFLLLGSVALLGCDRFSGLVGGPIPIDRLQQLEATSGRTVRLEGQVTAVVPLVGSGAYLLEDESGEVWVLAPDDALPTVGESVRLQGRLEVESVPEAGGEVPQIYVRQQQQQ